MQGVGGVIALTLILDLMAFTEMAQLWPDKIDGDTISNGKGERFETTSCIVAFT